MFIEFVSSSVHLMNTKKNVYMIFVELYVICFQFLIREVLIIIFWQVIIK